MKLHLLLLIVFGFVIGVFAGEKAHYYRLKAVNSNTLLVSCTEGRPTTDMLLDDVLKVYCHTPEKK